MKQIKNIPQGVDVAEYFKENDCREYCMYQLCVQCPLKILLKTQKENENGI